MQIETGLNEKWVPLKGELIQYGEWVRRLDESRNGFTQWGSESEPVEARPAPVLANTESFAPGAFLRHVKEGRVISDSSDWTVSSSALVYYQGILVEEIWEGEQSFRLYPKQPRRIDSFMELVKVKLWN